MNEKSSVPKNVGGKNAAYRKNLKFEKVELFITWSAAASRCAALNCLMPVERYPCCRDPLLFGNDQALVTVTFLPWTLMLVPF